VQRLLLFEQVNVIILATECHNLWPKARLGRIEAALDVRRQRLQLLASCIRYLKIALKLGGCWPSA
jgi:hypothetical protein